MKAPFDSDATIPGPVARYYEGRALFGGRFMLSRRLGRGGMGEVWQALDRELGEDVALKFAPPEVVGDERCVGELRREALAGRGLSHPHIVRVYDFHTEAEEAAVSMELVKGKSLNGLQGEREAGFFEVEDIKVWVDEVVEALRYAHGREKRIHRDLKPANIMVDAAGGQAKLVDFGISRKMADTYTRTTGKDTSGSLAYMGPQQLRGERTLPEDDYYSLGATVYELLTGAPPYFQGDIRTQIERVVPPLMAERRKELAEEGMVAGTGEKIPEEWEDAVARCLAKERAGRGWSLTKTVESPPVKEPAPPRKKAANKKSPKKAVAKKKTVPKKSSDSLPVAAAPPAPAAAPAAMKLPVRYRKGFLWVFFLFWLGWTGVGITDFCVELTKQSIADQPGLDVSAGRHFVKITRQVPYALTMAVLPGKFESQRFLDGREGAEWWKKSEVRLTTEARDEAEMYVIGGSMLGILFAGLIGGAALFAIVVVGIWSRHFLKGRCPITIWVLTWGYVGVSVWLYVQAAG